MANYGESLKYQREIAGLSQNALSKATGILQQNISNWENNKKDPSISNCVILADFYGISVDELIGRDTFGNNSKRTTITNCFNGTKIDGDVKF